MSDEGNSIPGVLEYAGDGLDALLREADRRVAQDGLFSTAAVLDVYREALHEHFFRQELHDRIGIQLWKLADKKFAFDLESPSHGERVSQAVSRRVEAALHWYLSERDDGPRAAARALIERAYEGHPESLYAAFLFPSDPVTGFAAGPVVDRLRQLQDQVREARIDPATHHRPWSRDESTIPVVSRLWVAASVAVVLVAAIIVFGLLAVALKR